MCRPLSARQRPIRLHQLQFRRLLPRGSFADFLHGVRIRLTAICRLAQLIEPQLLPVQRRCVISDAQLVHSDAQLVHSLWWLRSLAHAGYYAANAQAGEVCSISECNRLSNPLAWVRWLLQACEKCTTRLSCVVWSMPTLVTARVWRHDLAIRSIRLSMPWQVGPSLSRCRLHFKLRADLSFVCNV